MAEPEPAHTFDTILVRTCYSPLYNNFPKCVLTLTRTDSGDLQSTLGASIFIIFQDLMKVVTKPVSDTLI